jgi:transcription-repair coupling factor (superfamily II helicase)
MKIRQTKLNPHKIKADMESDRPMDRLVCGDVGFGKTEVAIRAAQKQLIIANKCLILVPTTILAYQHYRTHRRLCQLR